MFVQPIIYKETKQYFPFNPISRYDLKDPFFVVVYN